MCDIFQLFDLDNPVNKYSDYIFSTEGHIFRIHSKFRKKAWLEDNVSFDAVEVPKSSSPVDTSSPLPKTSASASDQAVEVESINTASNHETLDSDVVVSSPAGNMTYQVGGGVGQLLYITVH